MAKPATSLAKSDAAGIGGGIQVIDRISAILRSLRDNPAGLTQAEIADSLRLPRTTTHRILKALELAGLVQVGQRGGRYRLGPEIARMSASMRSEIVDFIHPHLARLCAEVHEAVNLCVVERDRITIVDEVDAPNSVLTVSMIGISLPLHCTAPGRAMLSQMPAARVSPLLRGPLTPMTNASVRTHEELARMLDECRESGISDDREETHEGVCAIACALPIIRGQYFALNIAVPATRFAGRYEELRQALILAREDLVRALEDADIT